MMEEFKSFYGLAEKVEPWNPSKEFLEDFSKYMEESIRQSKKMAAEAFISARDIVIF
jgi:cephalosporin-C deacetylase-like acetyl esterase